MGRQGILEPWSIISSKGTLKLSESTEIMGSFFPHLLITNILTHGWKKDVVGQLLQIGFSLMALLEASKTTRSSLEDRIKHSQSSFPCMLNEKF